MVGADIMASRLLVLLGWLACSSATESAPSSQDAGGMRAKIFGTGWMKEMPLHLRGGFSVGGVVQSASPKIDRSGSSPDLSVRSFISSHLQPKIHAPPVLQNPVTSDKDSIERSIDIAATPEEVFQVATRFEQYPEWAGVTAIKVLEKGRDGLGKIVKLDCGMFGRSLSYTLSYSYVRPRHMSWFAIAGSLKELVGSYDFQPLSGGGTRVIYKVRVDPGFYLPSVIKSSTSAFVATAALNNLKRYAELPSTKLSLHSPSPKVAAVAQRREFTPIWALSTLL